MSGGNLSEAALAHHRLQVEVVRAEQRRSPLRDALSLLDGNSIEILGLEFWLEKRLEIQFCFCDMSKLPIFVLSVGNLKPKLKRFFILNT